MVGGWLFWWKSADNSSVWDCQYQVKFSCQVEQVMSRELGGQEERETENERDERQNAGSPSMRLSSQTFSHNTRFSGSAMCQVKIWKQVGHVKT